MTAHPSLDGWRVLIVEDELMVALLEEELLQLAGCEVVGPAATVAQALKLVAEERLDGAVLDVNLGKETVYPVADKLNAAGVPFVFITGYGQSGLAEGYKDAMTIRKPFDLVTFERDLTAALVGAGRKPGR